MKPLAPVAAAHSRISIIPHFKFLFTQRQFFAQSGNFILILIYLPLSGVFLPRRAWLSIGYNAS